MVLLALLLINAVLGVFFIAGPLVLSAARPSWVGMVALLLPTLGLVAGGSMIRYPVVGLALGAIFYALQAIAYFGPEGNWGFRSGLHVSFTVRLASGALVVNALAILLSVVHVVAMLKSHAGSRICKSESMT
jgi:hypothetical protein